MVADRARHQGSVLVVAEKLEGGLVLEAVAVVGRVASVLVADQVASALVRAEARLVVASVDATQPSPVREPAVVATSKAGAQELPVVSWWALPQDLADLGTTGHRVR